MGSHIEMYEVSHALTSTECADLCEWLSNHFIYAAILSFTWNLQHPILWFVLNIGTKSKSYFRTRFNRDPVATSCQVFWINFVSQTSLIKNSDNKTYKMWKPHNENSSLKSTIHVSWRYQLKASFHGVNGWFQKNC